MSKRKHIPAENKPKSLFYSSAVVTLMTSLSRVLGLLRDVAIAYVFGATNAADAFFVAFKIPNFLRRLFAEGAFNQAFIPVLAEADADEGKAGLKAMLTYVSGCLLVILVGLTIVAVLAAPWIAWIFAPGFHDDGNKLALTADMLRITFPYLLLISMTALFGSVLNHHQRFAAPAAAPIILNLSLIGMTFVLAPMLAVPVMALAWGVMIAGILQLVWHLPFVARLGLLQWPRVNFANARVKQVLALMLPAMFGVSVAQISLLVDTILASLLETGSVSWLYYSDRLMELPLGIFGIAIATVILPNLSKQHAQRDEIEFSRMLDWAVRLVLILGIPAALALGILAKPLVTTLFHYGALNTQDVIQSASSLQAYAAGLVAFMLIKVLAPGFFARQEMRTPVRIAVWAMLVNMVFNFALVWEFAHVGLAAATSLSAFANAFLLGLLLMRQQIWRRASGWLPFLGRIVFANGLLVVVLLWLAQPVEVWLDWTLFERVVGMALLVLAGIGTYFLALLLSGQKISDITGASHLR